MRKVRTWIGGTPAILEGIEKEAMEKFSARFCVAQTLTIPKEGNTKEISQRNPSP